MSSIATCDRTMREMLLDCCGLDRGRISPAVFGSLFQCVKTGRPQEAPLHRGDVFFQEQTPDGSFQGRDFAGSDERQKKSKRLRIPN